MAPEYGATCGFFPTDEETINYLKLTGKKTEHLNIVEQYSKNKRFGQMIIIHQIFLTKYY